jgi:hypothetical protein
MTELDNFIKDENLLSSPPTNLSNGDKNKMLVINDSDYKSTRQTNLKFSTNYLNFKDELKLMMFKNFKIYSRNIKSIIFIFFTPILFLFIIHSIKYMTEYYSKTLINKGYPITNIDNINLKCSQNNFAKFDSNCISLGISIIVRIKLIKGLFKRNGEGSIRLFNKIDSKSDQFKIRGGHSINIKRNSYADV